MILIFIDIAMLYAGLFFGVASRNMAFFDQNLAGLLSPISKLFIAAVVILFVVGLYDIGRTRNTIKFFQKIALSAAVWFGVSVFFFYAYPNITVSPKTTLLLITLFGFSFVSLWRLVYNHFLSANLLKTPVVFIGLNKETKEIIETIAKFPERGFVLAGVVGNETLPGVNCGPDLNTIIKQNNGANPGLIVLSEYNSSPQILSELYKALYSQVSVVKLADFYESFFKRIPPFTFSEDWFITNLKEQSLKIYDRFRILIDLFFAIITGIVFIISFPLVALTIKITSPGPIFFSQKRVGRQGKEFTIHKYRTMKVLGAGGSAEKSGPQFASVNDARVTLFGKFLRRTRLDEIPQFWNILRGEMALIGPRPERPEFVKILSEQMPFYNLRHLIKPGITGWAQLQASYFGTIEENLVKLQYDLYYVKNRNLFLDIAIILRTFSVLFRFMGR